MYLRGDKLFKIIECLACIALIIVVVVLIVKISFESITKKQDIIEPNEDWNIYVLFDISGSMGAGEEKGQGTNSKKALKEFIDILRYVSCNDACASDVCFGMSIFDKEVKTFEELGPIKNKNVANISDRITDIPYDEINGPSNGSDIGKALKYAVTELKENDENKKKRDEEKRNIIVMFTDGKIDKVDVKKSEKDLQEAMLESRKINCELLLISPNQKNVFVEEGDYERFIELAQSMRFGHMYFNNIKSYNIKPHEGILDKTFENYIITQDRALMLKMMLVACAAVTGGEVELVNEEFYISESELGDTVELYILNEGAINLEEIKVIDPDGEMCKTEPIRIADETKDFVIVSMKPLKEGKYTIEYPFNKPVAYSRGDLKAEQFELTDTIEIKEKEFCQKIICIRKRNLKYKVTSETVKNGDYNVKSSVNDIKPPFDIIDGRTFNVPYYEKLVVMPVIEGEDSYNIEDANDAIKKDIAKNNMFFYFDNIEDLWKYCSLSSSIESDNIKGLSLTYEEKEGGFVGYVPIMEDDKYTVTINATLGYKTGILDYQFKTHKGISKKSSDNDTCEYEYDQRKSFINTNNRQSFSVGEDLYGRSIVLSNVTVCGKRKNSFHNNIQVGCFCIGNYMASGEDLEYHDKWTVHGTIYAIPVKWIIYVILSGLFIWCFCVKREQGYFTLTLAWEDKSKSEPIKADSVRIPCGKYHTVYSLIHIAKGAMSEKEFAAKENLETYAKKNKRELMKGILFRKKKACNGEILYGFIVLADSEAKSNPHSSYESDDGRLNIIIHKEKQN